MKAVNGLINTPISSVTTGSGTQTPATQHKPSSGPSFDTLLNNKLSNASKALKADAAPDIKFSQHALERIASRGLSFKPDELTKLSDAIDKAAKKGSRESLVLMGDNAFIVSVKNRTVVTAMDQSAMKENVFTNIDSTILL